MGRVHRLDPEHGIHHIYSRGTRRWTLFIDEFDYRHFIIRLGVVCMRYDIRVYAYCLMGNHFHLALYCTNGNISNAMRDLKSVFARQHNQRHGFSGPLFESRFRSRLVTSYEYLKTLVRYIHRNPAALDPSRPLEWYRWSSHAYYLEPSLPRPEWCDISFPRSLFGETSDYRQFIEDNRQSDKIQLVRSEDKIQLVRSEQPLSREPHRSAARPAISTIVLLVAESAGCDVGQVRPRIRNGLIGVVAVIASDHGGYTSSELTDACGFRSPQSLRNARTATRRRLAIDPDLRTIHDQTIAKLDSA